MACGTLSRMRTGLHKDIRDGKKERCSHRHQHTQRDKQERSSASPRSSLPRMRSGVRWLWCSTGADSLPCVAACSLLLYVVAMVMVVVVVICNHRMRLRSGLLDLPTAANLVAPIACPHSMRSALCLTTQSAVRMAVHIRMSAC